MLCIMAESPGLVAKALNRLTDEVSTDILTDRNRGSLSELVYRFLCSAPDPSDADESSKLAMNNDNTMNIHKNFALSESNSGVLNGFGILEEDWTLVHGAVVTCLYIICSLQSLPQPHLEITQECMKRQRENLKRMVSTLTVGSVYVVVHRWWELVFEKGEQ